MAKKKTELDKVLDQAAKLIQAQLDTLSPEIAERKAKELHQMAAKVSRSRDTSAE